MVLHMMQLRAKFGENWNFHRSLSLGGGHFQETGIAALPSRLKRYGKVSRMPGDGSRRKWVKNKNRLRL